MLFEFESVGEGKVLAASDRVVNSLGRIKESYRQVSREVSILRKSLNVGMQSGLVGGYVASAIASAGRVSADERKALSGLGEVGAQGGSFLGLAAGGALGSQFGEQLMGKLAGGILGRMVGGIIAPVLGSVIGSYIGEAVGGTLGNFGSEVLYKLGLADRGILPGTNMDRAFKGANAAAFGEGGDVEEKAMEDNFRFWSLLTGDQQAELIRSDVRQEAYGRSQEVRKSLQANADALSILMRI